MSDVVNFHGASKAYKIKKIRLYCTAMYVIDYNKEMV
jgi:hypothetical protein